LLQFMKLLLAVIILLAFVYTYAYPSYNEHSGHNHPDHHFSKRSADENNESAEHKSSSTEEEGDVDPVNDTTSPDNELQEIVEEECSEDKSRNEEGTTGEAHTKLSLKDQQGVHKVGKRNANAEGHDHHGEERDGTREKRSQSEEDPSEDGHVAEHEDHSESSQQFEAVEPSFRKRRDTGDHTDETDHSEQDDEEQHHHEKRSGHSGRHDHVQKRHADEHDHHEEEPTFASDDIHQV
ncbi:hypothetical protein V3C99_007798, partial [Haemonchus contortus]